MNRNRKLAAGLDGIRDAASARPAVAALAAPGAGSARCLGGPVSRHEAVRYARCRDCAELLVLLCDRDLPLPGLSPDEIDRRALSLASLLRRFGKDSRPCT